LAWPAALAHVNGILASGRFPRIGRLEELVKYRDVPNRPIPRFVHPDAALAAIVNQLLKKWPIPDIIDSVPIIRPGILEFTSDDAGEVTSHIDLSGALDTLTEPRIASLAVISSVGANLFVTDALADGTLAGILPTIPSPLEKRRVTIGIIDALVRRMPFDDVKEFAELDVRSFWPFSLSLGGQRFANSVGFDRSYKELELPIISNVVRQRAVTRIVLKDDFMRGILGEFGDVEKEIRPVDGFHFNVGRFKATDQLASDLLKNSFDGIDLPAALNSVDAIELGDLADELTGVSICAPDVRALAEFSRRTLLNSQKLDDLIGGFLKREVDLLIEANSINAATLAEIVGDDLDPDYGELIGRKCSALAHFMLKDIRIKVEARSKALVDRVFEGFVLPLVANTPSEEVIGDVVADFQFGFEPISRVSLSISCQQKEGIIYATDRVIWDICNGLFDELDLPIIPNVIGTFAISEICDERFTDCFNLLTFSVATPLRGFELTDSGIATGDSVISKILGPILAEADDELPIGPNFVNAADVLEIVNGLLLFALPTSISVDGLLHMNASERRIRFEDLHLPLIDQELQKLPLEANDADDELADEIVGRIGPLNFFDFECNDTKPLAVYQAPGEVVELLDELVRRLMGLIIARDIFPCLPIWEDVQDAVAADICRDVFDDRDLLKQVTTRWVDCLAQMRPTEVPKLVTPDDVITYLLNQFILPEIPVQGPDWADDLDDIVLADPITGSALGRIDDPIALEILRRYIKGSPLVIDEEEEDL
jgi:hypothetical protein